MALNLLVWMTVMGRQVVFNTMSLVFPYIGQKIGAAWIDPLGGMLLSLYSKSFAFG
jgi:hypothetical protein